MAPIASCRHGAAAVAAGLDRGADFFVSYTASDRAWAEWIAWELEDAGYRALIQAWDFRPGSDFVAAMREATTEADRTLAVLSPHYMHSDFALSEWGGGVRGGPPGPARKTLGGTGGRIDAEGLDRSRVWIDLVGLDEEQARQRLRAGPGPSPTGTHHSPSPDGNQRRPFPLSLPPVWNLPQHPNPNFTGRGELLRALEATPAGARTVLSQAITSLGGVGKTQLAAGSTSRCSS